ncbi:MAG: transglutaminase-like cysteine peptidase [Deltaproteobacteria bacterium]|jgi:predicted transglutaminase-like cysteine proteinase|nr:transglutaminase-like cysteine peptidase [Deltaproteobacteria bacterium]
MGNRAGILALAACLLLFPARAGAAGDLFNREEHAAAPSAPWRRAVDPLWQRVLAAEKAAPGFDAAGTHLRPVDVPAWKNLVAYAKHCPEAETLRMVNGYFNQWRPKKDEDAWQTPEYWATPREFFANRGGDCEDYAIAKYFALRFLGFPAERMRLVVVRRLDETGRSRSELHAILAVRANGTWFILDNNARPKNNIFPHTQYKGRFIPLYSMNENASWVHE